MSDTDSFIEEVSDEVRRDRLYGYLRRYGWIAILVIVLVVGGAAYSEYTKAQTEAKAQALGDAMLSALTLDGDAERAAALRTVEVDEPQSAAVLAFVTAGAEAQAGNTQAAIDALQSVVNSSELPLIYRQVATFRTLLLQSDTVDAETRRSGYSALAMPGVALRVLAEEQLALIDIEIGETDAAIARLQTLLLDPEASTGLQRRALQAIVALGGSPIVPGADTAATE